MGISQIIIASKRTSIPPKTLYCITLLNLLPEWSTFFSLQNLTKASLLSLSFDTISFLTKDIWPIRWESLLTSIHQAQKPSCVTPTHSFFCLLVLGSKSQTLACIEAIWGACKSTDCYSPPSGSLNEIFPRREDVANLQSTWDPP